MSEEKSSPHHSRLLVFSVYIPGPYNRIVVVCAMLNTPIVGKFSDYRIHVCSIYSDCSYHCQLSVAAFL